MAVQLASWSYQHPHSQKQSGFALTEARGRLPSPWAPQMHLVLKQIWALAIQILPVASFQILLVTLPFVRMGHLYLALLYVATFILLPLRLLVYFGVSTDVGELGRLQRE